MTPEELGAELGMEVHALVRLSGGASRQTWAFEGDGRPLVIQCQRPGGLTTSSGMDVEGRLVELAGRCGVPVARFVSAGGADCSLGTSYLVTERVEGETIPRKLLRDDAFAAVRGRLAFEAGAALAAVHELPVDEMTGLLAEEDQLSQFRGLLAGFEEPHPAFELGLRWLERHRPPSMRRTIVHGDFRNGNLVVGPDGLRAVLDWELAHIGDPVEDLGWFCVRAWRFGSPQRAGGFGTVEDLLSGYRSHGGIDIAPDVVRWWEAMGTLRWGVICMVQAATHLGGASRSVELAAIGRRTAECEWDLLELIA